MDPLDLVRLRSLMGLTGGREEIAVALLDGPVDMAHPDLAGGRLVLLPTRGGAACADRLSPACRHGTFVAGMLSGRRGGAGAAIAPLCTLLLRPLFAERHEPDGLPRASPEALADAIADCLAAGARIINLSAAIPPGGSKADALQAALDAAARRGVLVVAAAGNTPTLGASTITAHPAAIPDIACDGAGRPLADATLGRTIGRHGLAAPGEGVASLAAGGGRAIAGGSSAAAPFVTGALALLWSLFPRLPAGALRAAVMRLGLARRTVVPPLLDGDAALAALAG
jgi:subtilisin family serine protease